MRLTEENAREWMRLFISSIPECPAHFSGRGIVICGGGLRYFTNAWICVRSLRRVGCSLPIELWSLRPGEIEDWMRELMEPHGVRFVDAAKQSALYPMRPAGGWELKAFAILHSGFEEVLLLDADNMVLENPERLFASAEFEKWGAAFWPDLGHLREDNPIWGILGLDFVDEPEFESGQLLIHKRKAWKLISLVAWMNGHSEFFYRYVLGDKETFHLACRVLNFPFARPARPVQALHGALCQHDFEGNRLFQHRSGAKWTLDGEEFWVWGFQSEALCYEWLKELRAFCDGRLRPPPRFDAAGRTDAERGIAEELTGQPHHFSRILFDHRQMTFLPDGRVGNGSGRWEQFWDVRVRDDRAELSFSSWAEQTSLLRRIEPGHWLGRRSYHEEMPVELRPPGFLTTERQAPPPPAPNKTGTLVVRAGLNAHTGYGLLACSIVEGLLACGVDVKVRAMWIDERFGPLPSEIRKRIVCMEQPDAHELVLSPPGFVPMPGKRSVTMTMWESTRIPQGAVEGLNRNVSVIVPTIWNAAGFNAQGVTTELRIAPLGIDADLFRYAPMDMAGACVFGTGGRLESGGARKGIDYVIDLFQKAFPSETDVRLKVKVFPDCHIPACEDPRVEITRAFFTGEEMRDWTRSLTCFVSGSKGEGWGWFQHQAMALGRPVIAARFGGLSEFFNQHNGYCVDFQLTPGRGVYENCGLWAEPVEDSIIAAMRRVHANRGEAQAKGKAAAKLAGEYSSERFIGTLLQHLRETGLVA